MHLLVVRYIHFVIQFYQLNKMKTISIPYFVDKETTVKQEGKYVQVTDSKWQT